MTILYVASYGSMISSDAPFVEIQVRVFINGITRKIAVVLTDRFLFQLLLRERAECALIHDASADRDAAF